ncbi:ScbR family autoregulator-binding transcription factor [Streptomyces lydicus]|uniref:ScbR family autoregulator-binding transcription factor n=1 Tax=Streptomyces lydicus TaxID=47763 RepID=UPI003798A9CD
MVQQERAIKTRLAIRTAAAEVFAERGFDGASIAEILERAKVTKGALYFHFRDKQALADAILTEHVDEIRVEPDTVKLRELVTAGFTLVKRLELDVVQRAAARLTLEQGANQIDRAQPMLRWTEYVEELLTAAQEREELLASMDSPAERRNVAEMIVGSFAGLEMRANAFAVGGTAGELEHWLTVFFQTVLPTIAKPYIIPKLQLPSIGQRVMAAAQAASA